VSCSLEMDSRLQSDWSEVVLLRTASPLVAATNKVVATRIENVVFMELLPSFCPSNEGAEESVPYFATGRPDVACAKTLAKAVATITSNNLLQARNTQQRAGHAAAAIQASNAIVLEAASLLPTGGLQEAHTDPSLRTPATPTVGVSFRENDPDGLGMGSSLY
jgi:hypothetical protein